MRGGPHGGWSLATGATAVLAIVSSAVVWACASGGGFRSGHLVTVQLPPGFAGTWIRNPAESHVLPGGEAGPDTLRFGDSVRYRTEHPIRDRTDSVLEALTANPALAGKIEVEGHANTTGTAVKSHAVTVAGDTVIIKTETYDAPVGVMTRVTTYEFLSADRARLTVETTTEFPAQELRDRTVSSNERLLVFDRLQQ